jgi:hypothetical protein
LEQEIAQGADTPASKTILLPNLAKLFQSKSMVMMLSDFDFLSQLSPTDMGMLGQLRGHHQVSALLLLDPVEEHLSLRHGWLPLGDPVSCQTAWINTGDRWMVRAYLKAFRKALTEKESILRTFARVHRVHNDGNLLGRVIRWARAA